MKPLAAGYPSSQEANRLKRPSISGPGPHVAIVGAARSGTTYLAAQLGAHLGIDPGAVKEPNYYSREFARGRSWYDSLYAPNRPGVYRLDASTSLTFPHFREALGRLAVESPDALVIYLVRDPVPRAVSHYLYYRHYFHNEVATSFGAALRANPIYLGTSDYADWLARIRAHFPAEQLLVVPFELVTGVQPAVAHTIFDMLGLDIPAVSAEALSHRNDVVAFRHDMYREVYHRIRRSRLYPWARHHVGMDLLRRIRALVPQETPLPTVDDLLATCDAAQMRELEALQARSRDAVREHLATQDVRIGMTWSSAWCS
jgi:hypothetical protein